MQIRTKFLILILAVVPLGSETLLTPAQVRPGPVDSVFVTSSGLTGWVKLGDHEIVNVGGELVFRNTSGGGAEASWVQRVEEVTVARTDWVLLNAIVPNSLDVHRGGQLLSPGVDFTLSATTVTFLGIHVPQPSDVLRFKYQTP